MEFVNSQKGVLFVHIPRTAGSSLVKILFRELDNFHTLSVNRRKENHKYLKDYSQKFRDNNYIFSFVRNPWDRVVSSFLHLNSNISNNEDIQDKIKYLENYNGNFTKFVKNAFNEEEIFNCVYFKPQNEWICDEEGKILVDFLGRYENLEEHISVLSRILKIELGSRFFGEGLFPKGNYRNYYNKKTKSIIERVYSKDIKIFNYEF
jgi:chondroitin 4-sulfotransferase 11